MSFVLSHHWHLIIFACNLELLNKLHIGIGNILCNVIIFYILSFYYSQTCFYIYFCIALSTLVNYNVTINRILSKTAEFCNFKTQRYNLQSQWSSATQTNIVSHLHYTTRVLNLQRFPPTPRYPSAKPFRHLPLGNTSYVRRCGVVGGNSLTRESFVKFIETWRSSAQFRKLFRVTTGRGAENRRAPHIQILPTLHSSYERLYWNKEFSSLLWECHSFNMGLLGVKRWSKHFLLSIALEKFGAFR